MGAHLRVTALGVVCVLLAAGCGLGTEGHPPAESLAGEMTPEWEEFAGSVDRACATNYNASQTDLAEMEARAEREEWSNEAREAAYRAIQAAHQQATHDEIADLGPAPAEQELFDRWLWNVGRRAELMRRASRKWADKGGYGTYLTGRRIIGLKVDADWLGQRFGLRICTSNGPTANRESGENYVRELEKVCAKRAARDYDLWRDGAFTPNAAVGNALTETVEMAAVAPSVDEYPLRARILARKRALDRFQVRMLREEIAGSTGPGFDARVSKGIVRGREEIAEMGPTECQWPEPWR